MLSRVCMMTHLIKCIHNDSLPPPSLPPDAKLACTQAHEDNHHTHILVQVIHLHTQTCFPVVLRGRATKDAPAISWPTVTLLSLFPTTQQHVCTYIRTCTNSRIYYCCKLYKFTQIVEICSQTWAPPQPWQDALKRIQFWAAHSLSTAKRGNSHSLHSPKPPAL